MWLTNRFAPFVPSSVRMTGQRIYGEGGVSPRETRSGEPIRAAVRDEQDTTAEVTVAVRDGWAVAACDCDRFARGTFCEHLWATLLDRQQRGEPATDDELRLRSARPAPPRARRRAGARAAPTRSEPRWLSCLSLLRPGRSENEANGSVIPRGHRLCLRLWTDRSAREGVLRVETALQPRTERGYGAPKPWGLPPDAAHRLERAEDRALAATLLGAVPTGGSRVGEGESPSRFAVPPGARGELLRRFAADGRVVTARDDGGGGTPLDWEDETVWQLWLEGAWNNGSLELRLALHDGGRRLGLPAPELVLPGPEGIVLHQGVAARFDDAGASSWVAQFRSDASSDGDEDDPPVMSVGESELPRFLRRLFALPHLPRLDLPADARPAEAATGPPVPELMIEEAGEGDRTAPANVVFAYDDTRIRPGQTGAYLLKGEEDGDGWPEIVRRDLEGERASLDRLERLGARAAEDGYRIPVGQIAVVAEGLIESGWRVWSAERPVRAAPQPRLAVRSGVDWFELHGSFTYEGGESASLPAILAAARSGASTVSLDDGSEAVIPRRWLESNALVTGLGREEQDHLRFERHQALLLDRGLADDAELEADEAFDQWRQRFAELDAADEVPGGSRFVGTLRTYQRTGIGWMRYLRALGLGGILADDMGLGKTIQVLAFFDRLVAGEEPGEAVPEHPMLVVVPRSVLHNWLEEAGRFTPELRVALYSGSNRGEIALGEHDVAITTYAILRRDADRLAREPFDTVVLDEAQTIKNPRSQAAAAARGLSARHRLALTGTPVENHLGDLWSIVSFLNPGMLGGSTRFSELVDGSAKSPQSIEAAKQAGDVLRPLILRRRKDQVLAQLPEKTEQTVLCPMTDDQRASYDELLAHYRGELLGGGERSTMRVLEALLRLRQVACHPGLVDGDRAEEPSGKVEELIDRLEATIEEGHKALVFSQFTTFLGIVRKRLDERGLTYEYLDGQTRGRERRVQRFQEEAGCGLFLISLRAGGLGLNLTAADYVFLLDPWWNPAVEQQAIDRAHRLGQTQPVFAYRLICEDSVEQRIAELQAEKRELAASIMSEDGGGADLTDEQLRWLLS